MLIKQPWRLVFLLGCLIAPVRGDSPAAHTPSYTVVDLGTLPGGDHSGAYGINNEGQIVGWSDTGAPEPSDAASFPRTEFIHNHAVVWSHGEAQDLGLLKGFPFSSARAINDKGQVIGGWDSHMVQGFANDGGYAHRQEFLWQNGHRTIWQDAKLPYIDEQTAINDSGEIVGRGYPAPQHLAWASDVAA